MFTDAVERAVRWFQCPTDPAGVKKARYIDGGMWHIAFAASFNQTPKFVHRIDTLKAESHIACRAHAIPDHAVLLKATTQHCRRETACGLLVRVRLLPTTTRSSTKLLSNAYQSQMQVASVKPNTVCIDE